MERGNSGPRSLAISLRAKNFEVAEIVSRDRKYSRLRGKELARRVGAHAKVLGKESLRANLIWLCVPDREIAKCAKSLAATPVQGKIVLHSSGAVTSDELSTLRKSGAHVASMHPMMTFVSGTVPSLEGAGFAMEGDREAVRVAMAIVARIGGESFLIAKKRKALYHAWGTFVSPLVTSLLASSEQVARAAGVSREMARRWTLPIARQTIENYAKQGAARGFSGPIIRGDAATIKKHLAVLRRLPMARQVYITLARSALRTLPTRKVKELKALLD
ncbi:MAG TPA: Rossmann-like and DUF2520 domain-containing protein [Terriglobales bacterium]|nr:Rossmann-like and DUF2520 domain-containing protein [Terriglobales bacterium]